MTHTPGPWHIWNGSARQFTHQPRIVGDANNDGQMPCVAVSAMFENRPDIAQANARLIAAAPAMLEALQKLSRVIKLTREGKRDGGTFGMLSIADDYAQAVIAQATGENRMRDTREPTAGEEAAERHGFDQGYAAGFSDGKGESYHIVRKLAAVETQPTDQSILVDLVYEARKLLKEMEA